MISDQSFNSRMFDFMKYFLLFYPFIFAHVIVFIILINHSYLFSSPFIKLIKLSSYFNLHLFKNAGLFYHIVILKDFEF